MFHPAEFESATDLIETSYPVTMSRFSLGDINLPIASGLKRRGGPTTPKIRHAWLLCFPVRLASGARAASIILLEHRTRAEYCVNLGLKR